jgi:hypothetical protein
MQKVHPQPISTGGNFMREPSKNRAGIFFGKRRRTTSRGRLRHANGGEFDRHVPRLEVLTRATREQGYA